MLELNFQPFPDLSTERLYLRRMTTEDAQELFFLRSDPRVMQFIAREPATKVEDVLELIKTINNNVDNNEAILWVIALKEEPKKMIGNLTLWQIQKENYRAELGYLLHPDHWRKGIMKEALVTVIDFGFRQIGLHSIEARVDPNNQPSIILLEKLGFMKEAYFREDYYFRGKFLDTAVYSLLNES